MSNRLLSVFFVSLLIGTLASCNTASKKMADAGGPGGAQLPTTVEAALGEHGAGLAGPVSQNGLPTATRKDPSGQVVANSPMSAKSNTSVARQGDVITISLSALPTAQKNGDWTSGGKRYLGINRLNWIPIPCNGTGMVTTCDTSSVGGLLPNDRFNAWEETDSSGAVFLNLHDNLTTGSGLENVTDPDLPSARHFKVSG